MEIKFEYVVANIGYTHRISPDQLEIMNEEAICNEWGNILGTKEISLTSNKNDKEIWDDLNAHGCIVIKTDTIWKLISIINQLIVPLRHCACLDGSCITNLVYFPDKHGGVLHIIYDTESG